MKKNHDVINSIILLCGIAVVLFGIGHLVAKLSNRNKYAVSGYEISVSEADISLPVDINTADAATLARVDGITESIAGNIIRYRIRGLYADKKDVLNVPGVTEEDYEIFKNDITVK